MRAHEVSSNFRNLVFVARNVLGEPVCPFTVKTFFKSFDEIFFWMLHINFLYAPLLLLQVRKGT